MGVQINDEIGHFFQTKKSLRQGDPLPPILFNIVGDMLSILITRATEREREREQFRGPSTPSCGGRSLHPTICG